MYFDFFFFFFLLMLNHYQFFLLKKKKKLKAIGAMLCDTEDFCEGICNDTLKYFQMLEYLT